MHILFRDCEIDVRITLHMDDMDGIRRLGQNDRAELDGAADAQLRGGHTVFLRLLCNRRVFQRFAVRNGRICFDLDVVFPAEFHKGQIGVGDMQKDLVDHGADTAAGMSIRDIRQYIELALQRNDTIALHLQLFQHQRQVLLEQLEALRHTLEMVNYKCWYYETAQAAGTTDVPQQMPDNAVPAQFRAIRQELRQKPSQQR